MDAGSILGYGADACVFQEPVACELKSMQDVSNLKGPQVSRVLPLQKGLTEYKNDQKINVRIQELEPRNAQQVRKHMILNNLMCKPKFKPSDFTPTDNLQKCGTLDKTIQEICPSCTSVSQEVADKLAQRFVALQTPKYLTSLNAYLSGEAGPMKSTFDKAPIPWVEVAVQDVMRTCLLLNPDKMGSRFLHQDMHLGNVAITNDLRGAMADFGRSVFIVQSEPAEFLAQMQNAAFQNKALSENVNILKVQNKIDVFAQFTTVWAQIMQSVACLKLKSAEYFLSPDYKGWSHGKSPLMREQDILQRAAFVTKTKQGPEVWRDFLWVHVLPFVDLFGFYNVMRVASKNEASVPFHFGPMMQQIQGEFNLGTLSQQRALEVVTNAQARALATAQGRSRLPMTDDFAPGSDPQKIQEMAQNIQKKLI